jgi:hypothetical protein
MFIESKRLRSSWLLSTPWYVFALKQTYPIEKIFDRQAIDSVELRSARVLKFSKVLAF